MQQKMSDYEQPAPEVSWDVIDKAVAAGKPHKLTPLRYWLRGIAAATLLLLIAGVSYRVMHQHAETPDLQVTAIGTIPVNNEHTAVSSEQSQPELSESTVNEPRPTLLAESSVPHSKTSKVNNPPVISESAVTSDYTEEPVVSDTIADEAPTYNRDEQSATPERQTPPVHFSSDIQIPTRNNNNNNKRQARSLMAQAYMSNAMSGSRLSEHNILTEYNEIIIKPNSSFSTSDQNAPALFDTIKYVNTIQTNQSIRHHQPLRFGLSLRYQSGDRWSLESGLTYTLLVSDITTNENGVTNHTKQKLHYIGLPLNVGFKLWTDHKLDMYLTAGGTIDKLLNGSGWQFSLNGSAGAGYKLNNRFSLYFEPGIGYYFHAGNNLSTIYKDHPLNFNLSTGLRFNLK